MTKEEILKEVTLNNDKDCFSLGNGFDYFDGYASSVITAMEEYSNQEKKREAIAFKEWQDPNLEDKKWENYDGHDTWINPHTREVKSTEQLYDLYLKQTP